MKDEDINKLASKLTETLATKEDIKRLESEIKKLNNKADTILEFAEAVDEEVDAHGKRLADIESHLGFPTNSNN